jgi:uncharacterized protein YpmB
MILKKNKRGYTFRKYMKPRKITGHVDTTVVGLSKVLLLLVSLMLSGCTAAATVSSTDVQVLSVKEYYDDAFMVAREWQSDAYLQSANAIARELYDSRRPLRLSYSFLSKSKRSQALLVWIREDLTIDSEIVNLGGSTEDRRELQSEQWVLDSMDAIQIAQAAGGNEYISKNGSVEIDAYLEYWKKEHANTVIWRVSYLRTDGGGNLHIEVDAITGEVLELRE